MKKYTIPILYLFENVFYPDTIIPLILSDLQGQLLIKEAYQNDTPIALYSTHPKARGIATIGKIILLEEKEEGKLTAIISGIERIQLTSIIQHIPYPIYNFNPYVDLKESQILKEGSLERLFLIFNQWISRHVHNIHEKEVFLKEINTPKKLISNICLFMIKDIELKLLFLENTSLTDRIHILDALLSGEKPESENKSMAEAIKNFDGLEPSYKDIAN